MNTIPKRCLRFVFPFFSLATLPFSVTENAGAATSSARIMLAPELPLVGYPVEIFADLRYPAAQARVSYLVLEPGQRQWRILERNAPRASGIPRTTWTPSRAGLHRLRIDVQAPGHQQLRKIQTVRVHEDTVKLELGPGVPSLRRSTRLTANLPGGLHRRTVKFSVKYDDQSRWTTLPAPANRTVYHWEPSRAGRAEIKLEVRGRNGVITDYKRIFIRSNPQPVRMNGHAPGSGEFPPFKRLLSIDQTRADAGQERRLTVHMHGQPRRERRVTLLFRHETDSRWTVFRQNSNMLTVPWTPWKPGKYTLRVDIAERDGSSQIRDMITFTASDPRRP